MHYHQFFLLMHKGLPQILREGKGIKAHLALINRFLVLKFYDCLVFSRIINSYPLVAVFEFLGGSNYLDLCQLTLSKKKISATVLRDRLLQGAAVGAFFALIF